MANEELIKAQTQLIRIYLEHHHLGSGKRGEKNPNSKKLEKDANVLKLEIVRAWESCASSLEVCVLLFLYM